MDSAAPTENSDASWADQPWLRPELIAPWWEIALVALIIIGHSTLASSWQAWHGSSGKFVAELVTNDRMLHTLTIECPVLGLLFLFLNRRGWRIADFKIKPTWRSSVQGLALIPGMGLSNSITVLTGFVLLYSLQSKAATFLAFVISNSPHLPHHSVHVSWLAVIPALVVNGFYEEITCIAYAFNQVAAKRGPLFALILIVILRVSCHTYQGPIHALGIGAAFTVSGLVYWWTRNLWILIFAHILVDMLSFAAIKLLFG